MGELMVGLATYFAFYNGERPHQALGYKTPDVESRSAIGDGAVIVDKFARVVAGPLRYTPRGDSSTAEASADATAKPGQRRPSASEVEWAA